MLADIVNMRSESPTHTPYSHPPHSYLLCIYVHFQEAGPPSTGGSKSDCESRGRWFEPRSCHILSLRSGHETRNDLKCVEEP